jgi:hypothetical protein
MGLAPAVMTGSESGFPYCILFALFDPVRPIQLTVV